MSIHSNIQTILTQLATSRAKLIAVTKTRSVEELKLTFEAGIIDFGENKVQEMCEKQALLPSEIRWHQIGHLQSNKVKYIAPFVHLIHSVDSYKLLKEINKEALKNNRIISCLLQVHIAEEETKFGLNKEELIDLLQDPSLSNLKNIRIIGLMGMASFTEDQSQIEHEFVQLKSIYEEVQSNPIAQGNPQIEWSELSMGMSGDYLLAAKLGSTMVRVGSAIYGPRIYP